MRSPLLVGAIAATALAICTATSIPVIGTNDDIGRLAIGLASVLWVACYVDRRASRNQKDIAATRADLTAARAEVDQVRRLQKIEGMLEEAGCGSDLTLPTPHGDIHPVPVDISGETVLVGVDESADLANVVELRRAIARGKGRAAQ